MFHFNQLIIDYCILFILSMDYSYKDFVNLQGRYT